MTRTIKCERILHVHVLNEPPPLNNALDYKPVDYMYLNSLKDIDVLGMELLILPV